MVYNCVLLYLRKSIWRKWRGRGKYERGGGERGVVAEGRGGVKKPRHFFRSSNSGHVLVRSVSSLHAMLLWSIAISLILGHQLSSVNTTINTTVSPVCVSPLFLVTPLGALSLSLSVRSPCLTHTTSTLPLPSPPPIFSLAHARALTHTHISFPSPLCRGHIDGGVGRVSVVGRAHPIGPVEGDVG